MAGVLENVREDDYVEYFLFPKEIEELDVNDERNITIHNTLIEQIHSLTDKFCKSYIWHKDDFKLRFRHSLNNDGEELERVSEVQDNLLNLNKQRQPIRTGLLQSPTSLIGAEVVTCARKKKGKFLVLPHLHGITHYGDNIEDEWFIVYLLLQLTKEIQGLVVRIVDADGEFLLIEAAEFLPPWATPETCENNVYLCNGLLHIIKEKNISQTAALCKVRNNEGTLASQDVQAAILNRIKGYPQRIEELQHRTTVYVPVAVAALLKEKPNLIAPASMAFCNRDPIDLKACRAMRYFPPESRIMMSVVFTRCLYAMLTHQQYIPDKRVGWNLPPASSSDQQAHVLGMKIACGFEILVAQAKPPSDEDSNIANNHNWLKFLSSLKQRGYFQDNLEGSQDYNKLIQNARVYFENNQDNLQCRPSVGHEILKLLSELEINEEALRQLPIPPAQDDSWLNLEPSDLEEMLQQRYGKRDFITANHNSDPTNFTAQLSKFLDNISGVEGAEFPSLQESVPPVRPKRGIKPFKGNKSGSLEKESESMTSSGMNVSFDPDAFSCSVQNILDFAIPEDSWDLESEGSDMSSFGDDMSLDFEKFKQDESSAETSSELKQYMDQMDKELAHTTLGKSFEKIKVAENGKVDDNFEDIEDFRPVDIDMNALKNILESYQSQMGSAGPSSNLLGPMGVHLDPEAKC